MSVVVLRRVVASRGGNGPGGRWHRNRRRARGAAQLSSSTGYSATELVEGVSTPGRPEPLQVDEQPTGHRLLGRGPESGPDRLRAQRCRGHLSIVRASPGSLQHGVRAAGSPGNVRTSGLPQLAGAAPARGPARRDRRRTGVGCGSAPAALVEQLAQLPVERRAPVPLPVGAVPRRPPDGAHGHRAGQREHGDLEGQHGRSSPIRARWLAGRDERLARFGTGSRLRPGSPPAGPAPGTRRSA